MRRRRWTIIAMLAALLLTAATGAAVASFNKAATAAGSISSGTLAAPTSLAVTGAGPLVLNWTATASSYATGTRVLRSTTSGGPYSLVATVTPRTTTTYTDKPPGPGTYYYVVEASFQQWTSANSNQASGVRATISLVQSATGGGSSAVSTATFTSTPVAGHLLVALAGTRVAGIMTAPVGWSTAIDESNATAPNAAIYYKIAGAAEATLVTVATTATGSGNGLQLYEYAGASALLGTHSSSGSGTALATGSVTIADPYSLTIAGLVDQQGTSVSAWTGGFTERNDFTKGTGGSQTVFAGADAVQTVAGTFSSGATGTSSGSWRGQIAAFS